MSGADNDRGARLDLYHPRPKPATDAQLEAIKLTVDVAVGGTIFQAGTSLLQLVEQHRALYGKVYEGKDTSHL